MSTLSKSDFISEHFHFNKPLSLNDSLPSCLDINNFFENQQPYENVVGIPNTTHFINQFKKETGDTPLKYRQHHIQLGDSIPDSFFLDYLIFFTLSRMTIRPSIM